MTARRARPPASLAARLEALLARALLAADPPGALRKAARDARLPAPLREALRQVHPDGVQMSALLVARLRFERLLRGSAQAEWLYEQDAQAFTALFRRYHRTVPPTAFFPPQEAALFAQFLAAQTRRSR